MADCLIKKVATVNVYENKNEVRSFGYMAGDKNTPVIEIIFRFNFGQQDLTSCRLRWVLVDDSGSLVVGEEPIFTGNTSQIKLPNSLFVGERRMKVQLTLASADGQKILNLQQFTELKIINNLASNEVVEPVYDVLINGIYDQIQDYLDYNVKAEFNEHVEIQKTLATNDIFNFSSSKKTEINNLIISKKAEIDSYVNTVSKPDISVYADLKKSNLETFSTNIKNDLEIFSTAKKTEVEALLTTNNINSLESFIGKNYKGAFIADIDYNKGDIYFKKESDSVKFSINNSTSPIVSISVLSSIIEKFKVFEEQEKDYNVSNYNKNGIIKLNLGTSLQKLRDTHRISFSISDSSNPILELIQITKPIHEVFITPNPIKLLTHY
ncbi:MAG: hypothetical protein ACRC6E_03270 [Fusobacteriaceae bacterium]